MSLKQSRNSIDRIFNLSLKSSQLIAFRIYDRNGNGVIDEKDIIELMSEAESNQAIQKDLETVVKHYCIELNNENSKSFTV